MRYVALLRGINVGTHVRMDMKALKSLFESLGLTEVSTYINSGNILFESECPVDELVPIVKTSILNAYRVEVPILIVSLEKIKKLVETIPETWQNDGEQKTDVAFLFPDVDDSSIIGKLPVKVELLDIRYVPGALVWNIQRENYHKCQLNKLVSHKLYASMTLRNINTVRYLAKQRT
jgi:uncharacterized protein (DUF1697 family)